MSIQFTEDRTENSASGEPDSGEPFPSFTITSDEYAHELYRHVIGDKKAEDFLNKTDLYDCAAGKWSTSESIAPNNRESLQGSMYRILWSIVRRVRSKQPGVEREAIDVRYTETCQQTDGDGDRARHIVAVRAAGPSFQIPKPRKAAADSKEVQISLGYSSMATYFVVQLEAELGSEKEILDEMISYARRILKSQPNRFFVRSLVVTEKHARLCHFDRSGSQISPPIDIHEHPATFVRLVVGLSSADELSLGIDNSVQWTIANGRKGKGTVTTTSATGEIKTYPIIEEIPIPRDTIRSRATTCWRVQDPDTYEELVIKDSWRSDDSPAEHEMLELVKGIPGVVQMVSCEPGRFETRDLRCPSTDGQYQNKVFERVTMKAYSGPIWTFKTVLQLLCAMRDAIAGHKRLGDGDIRILHRDISLHNVMLGPEDAPEGERGALIDLDRAFRATDANPTVQADCCIGTRIFQSVSVLASYCRLRRVRPHDYLDDLESFFYLLVYIFVLFKPDGSPQPDEESGLWILREWNDDCPTDAELVKDSIFAMGSHSGQVVNIIKGTWGSTCEVLFDQFADWFLDIQDAKTVALYDDCRGKDLNVFSDLHSRRDQHYLEVLALFDNAIAAIKDSETFNCSQTLSAGSLAEPPIKPAILDSPTELVIGASSTITPPTPTQADAPPAALPPATLPATTPASHHSQTPLTSSPSQDPSPVSRKRRAEDEEHPESAPTKSARRVSDLPVAASHSP